MTYLNRIFTGMTIALWMTTPVFAAGGTVTGPNIAAPDRYVYYPGTEVLAEDEVRVIACGTGMPDARREQAAACFLFEFGNGEKNFSTSAAARCVTSTR